MDRDQPSPAPEAAKALGGVEGLEPARVLVVDDEQIGRAHV